jgi:hypothetical protein
MGNKSKKAARKAAKPSQRSSSRKHTRHQTQNEIDESLESQLMSPIPVAMPPIPAQPPGSAINPFAALFQRAPSSLTRENIVKDLTSPDNYELKTRIRNEFSMAGLDTLGFATTISDDRRKEMLQQYGIFTAIPGRIGPGEYLLFYGARVRLNAYSTNMGESRREVVAALQQVQFAEDKMKGRKILEGLFSESK